MSDLNAPCVSRASSPSHRTGPAKANIAAPAACKFGPRCRDPAKCRFSHNDNTAQAKLTPCKYGILCWNKDTCRFHHDETESSPLCTLELESIYDVMDGDLIGHGYDSALHTLCGFDVAKLRQCPKGKGCIHHGRLGCRDAHPEQEFFFALSGYANCGYGPRTNCPFGYGNDLGIYNPDGTLARCTMLHCIPKKLVCKYYQDSKLAIEAFTPLAVAFFNGTDTSTVAEGCFKQLSERLGIHLSFSGFTQLNAEQIRQTGKGFMGPSKPVREAFAAAITSANEDRCLL
jgi:hypothetical protein